MRRASIFASLAVIAIAGLPACGRADPCADAAPRARQACADLGGALRGRLMETIASNGLAGALAVCREIAPAKAAEISDENGLRIRRTSLRVRNPANAPDDWERKVLEDFAARAVAGEPIPGLEYCEEVKGADGQNEVRYMKAIGMEAACVACHGAPLAPEVTAELSRLYPTDAATNFAPGQVRGAFSVTVSAP
jgi:hypothetical protein